MGCPMPPANPVTDRLILTLLADGLTIKEIAWRLQVSSRSISSKISRLKRLLKADNIPHLITRAIAAGWIDRPRS
jgi:DNA-binding CsgD family transcriptional regulator